MQTCAERYIKEKNKLCLFSLRISQVTHTIRRERESIVSGGRGVSSALSPFDLFFVRISRDRKMESFLANRPDAPSKCTYTVKGDPSKCPHHLGPRQKSLRQHVYNNVLELIGDTPLVRVNRLARDAGVKCNLCRSRTISSALVQSHPTDSSGQMRVLQCWR